MFIILLVVSFLSIIFYSRPLLMHFISMAFPHAHVSHLGLFRMRFNTNYLIIPLIPSHFSSFKQLKVSIGHSQPHLIYYWLVPYYFGCLKIICQHSYSCLSMHSFILALHLLTYSMIYQGHLFLFETDLLFIYFSLSNVHLQNHYFQNLSIFWLLSLMLICPACQIEFILIWMDCFYFVPISEVANWIFLRWKMKNFSYFPFWKIFNFTTMLLLFVILVLYVSSAGCHAHE